MGGTAVAQMARGQVEASHEQGNKHVCVVTGSHQIVHLYHNLVWLVQMP